MLLTLVIGCNSSGNADHLPVTSDESEDLEVKGKAQEATEETQEAAEKAKEKSESWTGWAKGKFSETIGRKHDQVKKASDEVADSAQKAKEEAHGQ